MIDSPDWNEGASCAQPKNQEYINNFFSNSSSKQSSALKLCSTCPVRLECAKWALEEKQVWGIWGGLTPKRIRRTLSVNWEGQEMRHKRFPLCPGCNAKTDSLTTRTIERPTKGRWATMKLVDCMSCGFSWQSRTSANAVEAFYSRKTKKEQKSSTEN